MRKIFVTLIIILYFTTLIAAANGDTEERFSVSTEGAQLPTFIRSMALKAGYDSVVDKKLDGITLVTFTDKTLAEAMDVLAEAHNFNWTIKGNTLVAARTDNTSQMQVFPLQFADPEYTRKDLLAFLSEKQVTLNPDMSSLVIDGSYVQLAKASKRIKELDVPAEQIRIQVYFIELRQTDSFKLGLTHTWGSYDTTQANAKNIPYAATLEAEKIINNGKILASPSIMTINGRAAEIIAGDKVPIPLQQLDGTGNKTITYEYKDVGYKIKTTARTNKNPENGQRYITLALEPEASAITGYVTNAGVRAPQISTRTAKTNVRVETGGAILIGGLIKDEELKGLTGIPGLSKIPILGELFKSRSNSSEKTEIFIIVKPEIVNESNEVHPKTVPNAPTPKPQPNQENVSQPAPVNLAEAVKGDV